MNIVALTIDLILTITEHAHKRFHRDRHKPRVRHPTTIVAVSCISVFISTNSGHRNVILLRIILDWNQSTHAANRRGVAVVAGLQQQQGIGAHERRSHRDLGAIGQTEVAVDLELLDAGEDVIPTACIESC